MNVLRNFLRPTKMKAKLMAVYLPILAMASLAWIIVLGYNRRVAAAAGFAHGMTVIAQDVHRAPAALALALVCFLMGFRHAMDVDHIAAIDNVTRKLTNDGGRPVAVGFFFSLGHSIAVLVMATALVLAERLLKKDLTGYSDMIDMVGSSVCALVLYLLACLNIPVIRSVLRNYKAMAGGAMTPREFDQELQSKGFMNRYFRGLYRGIRASWQMLPIGFLFGLGFDTTTEMVVLAATATAAASAAIPLPMAFVCLMLFFSSMMFLDTTDSVAMLQAYSWAYSDPRRKVFYNLSMTGISMLLAFGIGTAEWLQVLAEALGLKGGLWYWLNRMDLTTLGVGSALLFMLVWLLAVLLYKRVPPADLGAGPSGSRGQEAGA